MAEDKVFLVRYTDTTREVARVTARDSKAAGTRLRAALKAPASREAWRGVELVSVTPERRIKVTETVEEQPSLVE